MKKLNSLALICLFTLGYSNTYTLSLAPVRQGIKEVCAMIKKYPYTVAAITTGIATAVFAKKTYNTYQIESFLENHPLDHFAILMTFIASGYKGSIINEVLLNYKIKYGIATTSCILATIAFARAAYFKEWHEQKTVKTKEFDTQEAKNQTCAA